MISRGVEISIAGGGADEKDGEEIGGFYFYFFYHIFIVKVQEIAWRACYGESKTQKPQRTNKGNSRNYSLQLGSVPVSGSHMSTTLK